MTKKLLKIIEFIEIFEYFEFWHMDRLSRNFFLQFSQRTNIQSTSNKLQVKILPHFFEYIYLHEARETFIPGTTNFFFT